MINANWLFLIIPGCFIFGYFICAICVISKKSDEMIEKIYAHSSTDKEERSDLIREATELVIEAVIDHGYIEDSRSEGDYDLNVRKEGTEKIRKILEAL